MNELPEQNPRNNEIVKLILDALQVPVKIARQTIGSIFVLASINIVSGAWLAFLVCQKFNLHISLTAFAFLVVAFPSILLSKLYLTLKEIIELPDKIVDFFRASSYKISEFNQAQERVKTKLKNANWRVDNLIKEKEWRTSDAISAAKSVRHGLLLWKRLRSYFALARRMRDVQSIFAEFEGLATLTANAMLLANPIFLTTGTISIFITLIWGLCALVTFLFYVL
jgi:hypothetical protein